MGHAFIFCSKIKNTRVDDLLALLNTVKEHIKDPTITDIVEKQGQSIISLFPIDKLLCKLLFVFIKYILKLSKFLFQFNLFIKTLLLLIVCLQLMKLKKLLLLICNTINNL